MVLEDAITKVIRDAVRDAVREELAPALRSAPAQAVPVDDLLTITEAATAAKLSAATISKWLRAGKLPRHGSGRNTRVSRAELEAALGRSPTPRETVDDQALALLRKGGR